MDCDICKRIKENRKRMGMTQAELGKCLGVQKSAIQKYESGGNHYKLETIIKLAEVFEISVATLIGERQGKSELRHIMLDTYGVKGLGLLEVFTMLNDVGQIKVLTYARDIMPNYTYSTYMGKKGDGL